MNTKNAVSERIIQLCNQKNIAINALANMAGISPSTLYSVLNEKSQNPGIVTIKKLCDRCIVLDHGKKIYDGSLEALKDSYGTRRKISMEVKKPEALKNLKLNENLSVDEKDYDTILDTENSVFTISFDKHKIHAPQILAAVMEVSEVTDIKLQETELAEIVKEIYNHGMENGGE